MTAVIDKQMSQFPKILASSASAAFHFGVVLFLHNKDNWWRDYEMQHFNVISHKFISFLLSTCHLMMKLSLPKNLLWGTQIHERCSHQRLQYQIYQVSICQRLSRTVEDGRLPGLRALHMTEISQLLISAPRGDVRLDAEAVALSSVHL